MYLSAGRSEDAIKFEDDVKERRPQRGTVIPTLQHQTVPGPATTASHTARTPSYLSISISMNRSTVTVIVTPLQCALEMISPCYGALEMLLLLLLAYMFTVSLAATVDMIAS